MVRHYGRRACAQSALRVVHAMAVVWETRGSKPRARRMGLSIRRKSGHLAWRPFKNDNGDKMSGFLPLRPGLWWMRKVAPAGQTDNGGCVDGGGPGDDRHGCPVVGCGAGCCRGSLCPVRAVHTGLASDLQSVAHAMVQTTRGDLSARAGVNGRDEVASMAQSLDRMVQAVVIHGGGHPGNAALVAHAGQSLAQGNRSLAERTEQQAANLEQTAASVEQLSSAVQDNAQTARSAMHGPPRCARPPTAGPKPWPVPCSRWRPSSKARAA